MTVLTGEKRREPRRPGHGVVRIRWNNPAVKEIEGWLMDVSDNGFRVEHGCTTLAAGQTVEFAHVEGKGTARAVWTRILEGRAETGFFVVSA